MCDTCEILFEEFFTDFDEAKKYQNAHPCQKCDSIARRVLSAANFQFVGTPGNSGSHDLDYPVLDKAVGRSSAEKWKTFHETKEKRDKLRKQCGQHAITEAGGQAAPTPMKKLELREKAIKTFKEAMKDSSGKNG